MKSDYLISVIKQFEYYKALADKTIAQVPPEKLAWQFNEESNSIAIIMKHLSGNMLSRWTDFLTSDGEKEWRKRDEEFELNEHSPETILQAWEKGWSVFLSTLKSLTPDDLEKIIYIRNQGHTVAEAVNRQLAHYPYHVGQIVFTGKMIVNTKWQSLSIPKGKSQDFNAEKFSQEKARKHFTDEFINRKND